MAGGGEAARYEFELRRKWWSQYEVYLVVAILAGVGYLLFTRTDRRPLDVSLFALVCLFMLGLVIASVLRDRVAVDATTLYSRDLDLGTQTMPRDEILRIQEHTQWWVAHGRSDEQVWMRLGWKRSEMEELARVLGVPLVLIGGPEPPAALDT